MNIRNKILTIFILALTLGWASGAKAQQLPSGLISQTPPLVLVGNLPTCNTTSTPAALYQVSDSLNACAYPNAVTGGGSTTCSVQCDNATSTWRMQQPPDIAPPTAINALTGTGGGYTNCVNGVSTSGCMTGIAQFAINNVTTSASTNTVSSPSFALTSGNTGWLATIVQNNGTQTNLNGGFGGYNGCSVKGTITFASATSFTFTKVSSSGSDCNFGSSTVGWTGTTGTAVLWDGKDDTGFAQATTAASNLATAYNTGGVLYLPAGTYVLAASDSPHANITIQCQSPNTTTIINPLFDATAGNASIFIRNSRITVEGCTFAGTNTHPWSDIARREFNNWIKLDANSGGISNTIQNNVFEYLWGDQGVNVSSPESAAGSAPCAYGKVLNSSNVCQALVYDLTVANNYFYRCADRGFQPVAMSSLKLINNKTLDCSFDLESASATNSAIMFSGLVAGNDIACDATGSGDYQTGVAAGYTSNEPGCSLADTDDGVGLSHADLYFIGNHIHSPVAAPAALCWAASTGTKAHYLANTCTSGENCSNRNSGCAP